MTDKKKKPSAINIKRLEELMTEQGLTIEELAERAGVSAATIASIRSNRRPNTTGAKSKSPKPYHPDEYGDVIL